MWLVRKSISHPWVGISSRKYINSTTLLPFTNEMAYTLLTLLLFQDAGGVGPLFWFTDRSDLTLCHSWLQPWPTTIIKQIIYPNSSCFLDLKFHWCYRIWHRSFITRYQKATCFTNKSDNVVRGIWNLTDVQRDNWLKKINLSVRTKINRNIEGITHITSFKRSKSVVNGHSKTRVNLDLIYRRTYTFQLSVGVDC